LTVLQGGVSAKSCAEDLREGAQGRRTESLRSGLKLWLEQHTIGEAGWVAQPVAYCGKTGGVGRRREIASAECDRRWLQSSAQLAIFARA
jgi:hypothetical protein